MSDARRVDSRGSTRRWAVKKTEGTPEAAKVSDTSSDSSPTPTKKQVVADTASQSSASIAATVGTLPHASTQRWVVKKTQAGTPPAAVDVSATSRMKKKKVGADTTSPSSAAATATTPPHSSTERQSVKKVKAGTPPAAAEISATSGDCSSGMSGDKDSSSSEDSSSSAGEDSSSSSEAVNVDTRVRKRKKRGKKRKRPFRFPSPKPSSSPLPPHGIKLPGSGSSQSADIKSKFVQFLNDKVEVFRSQIEADKVIFVDFMNLLVEKKELAIALCNEKNVGTYIWLNDVLKQFVENNGLKADNLKLHFINKPNRIYPAKVLLSSPHEITENVTLFCSEAKKVDIFMATLHARIIFCVIVWGILEELKKGNSWKGMLNIEDLLIAEQDGHLQLIILKDPVVKGNASPQDRALDVNCIWTFIDPFVKSSEGKLPVYFEQLKVDLMNASSDDIEQEWFFEYIKFHPAWAPSVGRRNLLIGLYQNCKTFRFDSHPLFRDFLGNQAMANFDWRQDVKSDKILKGTFFYRLNQLKKKRTFKDPAEVFVYPRKKQKTNEEDSPEDGEKLTTDQVDDGVEFFAHPTSVTVRVLIRNKKPKEGEGATQQQVVPEGSSCGTMQEEGGQSGASKVLPVETKDGEDADQVPSKKPKEGDGAVTRQQIVVPQGSPVEQLENVGKSVDAKKVLPDGILPDEANDGGDAEKAEQNDDNTEWLLVKEFDDTTGSFLKFKRHSLTHTDENIKVKSPDDTEMYGAYKYPNFLPNLIRGLLQICGMRSVFRSAWSAYKSSIQSQNNCSSADP